MKRSKEEQEEGIAERKKLKAMIKQSKNPDLAIEIIIGDQNYFVGYNAFVKHLLNKELNEVNKYIKGKKNKWE